VWITQPIEGLRVADLRLGSASAKTVTIQFGVKAPAGTYCVVILNAAGARNYVAEYTITGGEANTDVVKSVTIAGDTTGTWASDTGTGLNIRWGLMAGSTWQQAANAWGTTNAIGSSNQFNFLGTNGNVFELFDVGLYEGSVAPAFTVPDYPSELLACQRYYWRNLTGGDDFFGAPRTGSSADNVEVFFPASMRAYPTLTTLWEDATAGTAVRTGFRSCWLQSTNSSAGHYLQSIKANARL
jgi:hypothetical protein